MTAPRASRSRTLAARLRGFLGLSHKDDWFDEEVQHHLRLLADRFIAQGMSREEAALAARRQFGNPITLREDRRALQTFPALSDVAQDVRVALRTMRRQPAFGAMVVLTLALGIGATTAMFSVLDAVLFRPIPYRSPDTLAMLWTEDPTQNLHEGRSPIRNVEYWRCESQTFGDIAIFDEIGMTLAGADTAERIAGASMSHNLLPLLGVQPVRGRNISTLEAHEQQRLVLVSHRFWQARFGGSNEAVGATLLIDGQPARIIGILPADFRIATFDADVWQLGAPLHDCEAGHGPPRSETQEWFAVGRLRPGVSIDRAQAEMSAIARRLNDQVPAAERIRGITVVPFSLHMVAARSRLALWLLGGAVVCVLFIATANAASLSLARGVGRARELAVRAALGASAGRIARQLLTETVVFAVASGAVGILFALAGIRVIRAYGPGNLARLNEASLDLRALGWALAISLLTGILVGVAPAITAVRRSVRPSGEEGRRVIGSASTRRIRRALVVAEFALAMVLLAGAGLLVRSWWNVGRIDPGLRPERVLAMDLTSPTGVSDPVQRSDFYHRVLEQIRTVPGVQSAGISGDFFSDNPRARVLTYEGKDGTVTERLRFSNAEVSIEFFETIGTPLLKGRAFSTTDGADAPPVAIVNETMARRLWPGRDAVGRRLKLGAADADTPQYTVVGVAADMHRQGVEREPMPDLFVPLDRGAPRNVDLFVRTSADFPPGMAAALRAAVGRVDKRAPIEHLAPLEQQLGAYLAQRRFQTTLLNGFAGVALLMAVIGIYGLIQYSVATRTQEIGLRMAIGAQTGDIFRMIFSEGLVMSLSGLALGIVGALWVGRAVGGLLFGVTATDPWTFVTVSLLLTSIAAAACYVPARRATKVDPIVSLRVE
jgi:predicted permease